MDRNSQAELIQYAENALKTDKHDPKAFIALSEAQRLGPLEEEWANKREQLSAELGSNDTLEAYLNKSAPPPPQQTADPKSILIITNIFPPQELGGFGKYLFEFAAALKSMGHNIQVLSANIEHLHCEARVQDCTFENEVDRSLMNYGDWSKMPPMIIDDHELALESATLNHARILEVVEEFKPDYCMIGNLDLIGYSTLREIPKMGIPTLHICGNTYTGYHKHLIPTSPLYRTAPCSQWLTLHQREEHNTLHENFTLYAGSPLKDYYQFFPPRFDKLRIACACLIISRKGVNILIRALGYLRERGIDFVCEIAGTSSEPEYRQFLDEKVAEFDLKDQVQFIGFQNNEGLRKLFGRSNVFVFPTTDKEPFGKSSIEAMAAGLLLISSATGGQAEIFEHGKTGLKYKPTSPQELADHLYFVHNNPEEWKRIAAAGQNHAFSFDTMRCAEKIIPIFESIESDIPDPSIAENQTKKIEEKSQLCRKRYLEAISSLAEGKKDEALKMMKNFDEFGPLSDFYIAQACFKMHLHKYDAAANLFSNNVLEHPTDWRSYVGLSMLYKKNNNAGKALNMLTKAQRFNPQEPFVYLALISTCKHFKLQQEAEAMESSFQKTNFKTSCASEFMPFFESAIA